MKLNSAEEQTSRVLKRIGRHFVSGKSLCETLEPNILLVHCNRKHIEGSLPEWCISNMIYSGDTPFWSETLDMHTTKYLESQNVSGQGQLCQSASLEPEP